MVLIVGRQVKTHPSSCRYMQKKTAYHGTKIVPGVRILILSSSSRPSQAVISSPQGGIERTSKSNHESRGGEKTKNTHKNNKNRVVFHEFSLFILIFEIYGGLPREVVTPFIYSLTFLLPPCTPKLDIPSFFYYFLIIYPPPPLSCSVLLRAADVHHFRQLWYTYFTETQPCSSKSPRRSSISGNENKNMVCNLTPRYTRLPCRLLTLFSTAGKKNPPQIPSSLSPKIRVQLYYLVPEKSLTYSK